MKKRRRLVFVGLVVVLLAAAAWFALRPREPVYQGKKLSEWLEQAAQWEDGWSPERDEAVTAIEHIGTNAIPFLLADLQAKHLPELVVWLMERVSPYEQDPSQRFNRERGALAGFGILGPKAESAIPELEALRFRSDSGVATLAQHALREIGGEGTVSILMQGLTNANLQDDAALLLGSLRSQASLAVPALATNLEAGANARMRQTAAKALGQIALQPKLAVPALLERLPKRTSGRHQNS